MEDRPKRLVTLLVTFLGPLLTFLGICLPWFYFVGTAQYYWGTVEVSGWVSLLGTGMVDGSDAKVTMWSSQTYWSTTGSDFWFGYLSIAGLILTSASTIVFLKADKPKTSITLTLIGCLMVVSASLIALLYYKPYIFIIEGQIKDVVPSGYVSRLYATQAIVNNGFGPWLSFIGSIVSVITCSFAIPKFKKEGKCI